MSGSTIGSIVGGGIGFLIGGPAGAKWGFMIGGTLGGIVDPVKIKGPRLGDGQTVTSQEGIPIPFGFGTFPVGGNIIWADVLVEHEQKEGGKGGPQTISYTYTRSYAVGICEGEITAIQKAWRNGKLVYDISPTSTITGQNSKFLESHTFYLGSETQNVDPTIEASVGVGNSGPMRGLAYMVAEDEDLTDSGGAVAQWRFVVQMCGTVTETTFPAPVGWWKLDELSGTTAFDSSGNGNDGTYDGNFAPADPISANSSGCMECVDGTGGVRVPQATILDVGTNSDTWSVGASFAQYSRSGDGSVLSEIVMNWGSAVSGYHNWGLYLTTDGRPSGSYTKLNTDTEEVEASSPVDLEEPHRLLCVRDEDELRLYLDGTFVASAAVAAGQFSWPGGVNGICIGSGDLIPASYGFIGRISDVQVFDVALTPSQAQADAGHFGLLAGGYAVPDAPGIYVDEAGNLITDYATGSEVSSCGADLADIVAALCERSGIEASEYDVTDLAGIFVKGYGCATESSAQGFIEPLANAFFFDRGEWDKKVRFIPRGGASVATLDPDDLLAMDGPAIAQTRVQEVELLRKVNVMTIDPEAEFNATKQTAERRIGTIQATGESTVEMPIVMDADTAAQIADKRLKVAWGETDKFSYGYTLAHADLTATDVITLTDKQGVSHRQRLQAMAEERGAITIEEAVKTRASIYDSTATGAQNPNLPIDSDVQLVGPTLFAAMALPMLRSQDNTPGLYVGLAGVLDGWAGAQLLMSVDGGLSYTVALSVTVPTIMGELIADEDSNGEPIQVRVFGGTLESATTAQVDVGKNWSAIETAGVAEIVAYETATPTSSNTYDLTDTTRALDDTSYASHNAGDPFMDLSTAYFLPISQSFAGSTLYFKAVGFGVSADAVDPVAVAWAGVEYVEDGGEVTP